MGINSAASKKTQVFPSFLASLGIFAAIATGNLAWAGTDGTPEGEQARLQDEIDEARNALDALVLRPGVKLDDPKVREKKALVEEKVNAFRKSHLETQNAPPSPKIYPNKTPDRPNGEREEKDDGSSAPATIPIGSAGAASAPSVASAPEAPPTPATVLSGEGIQSEITYTKKSKGGKLERPIPKLTKKDHAQEPVPAETSAPDASGLSEIRYPKK